MKPMWKHKQGIETARLNGKQIGLTAGTKLTAKKSVSSKEVILKHSKDFNGTLDDGEVMKLTEPDESGRRKPVGTNEFIDIDCDFIISAIGQIPEDIYDKKILNTDHGYIVASNGKTNIEKIYAGGDIYLGAKTVVEAMRCGREFAKLVYEENK